ISGTREGMRPYLRRAPSQRALTPVLQHRSVRANVAASGLTWRPQLDGIRALAVLLVGAYHAWPQAVPNGGLGVTIFFVLSGFLITSLLVDGHAATGPIDLTSFYVRRALPPLPALAAPVAICRPHT